jgi:hypothetical protein
MRTSVEASTTVEALLCVGVLSSVSDHDGSGGPGATSLSGLEWQGNEQSRQRLPSTMLAEMF